MRTDQSAAATSLDALLALEPHPPTMNHMAVTRTGPVALYVGEVSPHQRIDRLVAAYHVLVSHLHPAAKLVVVGPSQEHGYHFALQRQIRELNLPNAWIAGDRSESELVALYRNADLYLTIGDDADSSIAGRSAMWALAFGVPVVAQRSATIAEAVGDAGLILEPSDGIEVVAEAAAEVITNEPLRSMLVDRGRARAVELSDAGALPRRLALPAKVA